MIVQYLGEEGFRLQSGERTLLVNPGNNRFKADVVLRTLTPASAPAPADKPADIALESGEISSAGEYEVQDIEIRGWQLDRESTDRFVKTVYAVIWEDIKFVFLGHLSDGLPADVMAELEDADVLFVPTGDAHFISPVDAAKLVKQLEPAVVVPSVRKNPAEFLKAMGEKGETLEKFVFKKKDLAGKKLKTYVLSPA